ncbi:DgyrCDS11647 [Dimorphilus gyrociliatus]|uniref:DgyrCDS11647 n=1 Tax=Dimorphilus gyrociliatus TaxID=2664684 RepID=A0A7I8W5B5_9ANNE|nr:DgyrCDS11647 [Dimorphilus gyrociliatus]
MDRSSRSELLTTIESQREQLAKYGSKLGDLVRAYKGLLKEKEALEASVKALSAGKAEPTQKSGEDECESNEAKNKEESEEETLRKQIKTLTLSLSTVTEEKTKMASNYQAEKKILKSEHETAIIALETELQELKRKFREIEEKSQEWKGLLIIEQHEREKEHSNYAMQLKELQKLLGEERHNREMAESLAEEFKQVPKPCSIEVGQYEKKVNELSEELNIVRKRLAAAEESASKPPPLLLELQRQMLDMKAAHQVALTAEQKKTKQAENRATVLAEQNEQRVATLECRLAELSEVVGTYEKNRTEDQENILRLKERVTQLDSENTVLAKAAGHNDEDKEESDDANLDVQGVINKIFKLQSLLKKANERSEKPVNLSTLLPFREDSYNINDEETIHKKCREEYDGLKEEFERYKLRAQSVLKNKWQDAKDGSVNKEVETLRNQLTEQRKRVKCLRDSLETQKDEHKITIEELRKSLSVQAEKSEREKCIIEAEHAHKLAELQFEIKRHRERTVSLLAEKERELDTYRSTHSQAPTAFLPQSLDDLDKQEDTDSTLSALLTSTGDKQLLHFSHEQARKDIEIAQLRKTKNSLESSARQLQQQQAFERSQCDEQVQMLKDEIRRLERNRSRESANLEYLKNIVYQYMIRNDLETRQRMLNAIATILEFSPKEKRSVLEHLQGRKNASVLF